VRATVKSPENSTVHIVAVPNGSTQPTSLKVKEGKDADGALLATNLRSSTAVAANTETVIQLDSLPVSTLYDLYLVTENSLGVLQDAPYKITAYQTDGDCGSANGVGATSAPSLNLCDSGAATSVTGSSQWTWQCIASRTTADCSAPFLTFPLTLSVTGSGTVHSSTSPVATTDINCSGNCGQS
jgi:hypothetical protein